MNKQELRIMMRNKKREYSQEKLEALSLPVIAKLLSHPLLRKARTIIAYYSLPDEVCTHELLDKLVTMGKTVLLPKVISDTEMTIHQYTSTGDLTKGRYSIMEPPTLNSPLQPAGFQETERLKEHTTNSKLSSELCSPEHLRSERTMDSQLIILPGMAFDKKGHRLGRGKGYYDRFLSRITEVYKIGICFPFQIVDEVPHDIHDIVMNEVIC